jgi:LDH2 family malate/lactate/ureidoglycolate dehydrogenase
MKKAKPATKEIDVWLPPKLWDFAKSQAKAEGITAEEWVVKAMDRLIKEQEAAA